MEPTDERYAAALALLTHPRSPKRRSGAKQLRRMGDAHACSALLTALQREVRDVRTWETQYQLIMALGTCGCREALPFLCDLATRRFDATMVYDALGNAIVRLERSYPNDPAPVLRLLATGNAGLCYGALAAVATLRLELTPEAVRQIIAFAEVLPLDRSVFFCNADMQLRLVTAVAAAGWNGPEVEAYLCWFSEHTPFRRTAEAALRHEYDPQFRVV